MKKKKKKKILLLPLIMIITSLTFIMKPKAYGQTWKTTINLAAGSTLYGQERNALYKGHKIEITPTYLYFVNDFGYHDKGKTQYVFYTGTTTKPTGGLKADPVYIYTYS